MALQPRQASDDVKLFRTTTPPALQPRAQTAMTTPSQDSLASSESRVQSNKKRFGAHYETQIKDGATDIGGPLQSVVNSLVALVRDVEHSLDSKLRREESIRQMSILNLELQIRQLAAQPQGKPATRESASASPTPRNTFPVQASPPTFSAMSSAYPSLHAASEPAPQMRSITALSAVSMDSAASSDSRHPKSVGQSYELQIRDALQGVDDPRIQKIIGIIVTLVRHIEACLNKRVLKEAEARASVIKSLEGQVQRMSVAARIQERTSTPRSRAAEGGSALASGSDTDHEIARPSEAPTRELSIDSQFRRSTSVLSTAAKTFSDEPQPVEVGRRAPPVVPGRSATLGNLPSFNSNPILPGVRQRNPVPQSSLPLWMRVAASQEAPPTTRYQPATTSRSLPPASRLGSLLEDDIEVGSEDMSSGQRSRTITMLTIPTHETLVAFPTSRVPTANEIRMNPPAAPRAASDTAVLRMGAVTRGRGGTCGTLQEEYERSEESFGRQVSSSSVRRASSYQRSQLEEDGEVSSSPRQPHLPKSPPGRSDYRRRRGGPGQSFLLPKTDAAGISSGEE